MAAEIVNMHQAKTHLSRLVERVEAGEEVVIARAGRPVARLVPYPRPDQAADPRPWRGQGRMADDFDAPIPELLDALEFVVLLLDAHVLLWWLFDDANLRASARRAIADPATDVLISAATIWEMRSSKRSESSTRLPAS